MLNPEQLSSAITTFEQWHHNKKGRQASTPVPLRQQVVALLVSQLISPCKIYFLFVRVSISKGFTLFSTSVFLSSTVHSNCAVHPRGHGERTKEQVIKMTHAGSSP